MISNFRLLPFLQKQKPTQSGYPNTKKHQTTRTHLIKTQTQTDPDRGKTLPSKYHDSPSSPASTHACRAPMQPDPEAKKRFFALQTPHTDSIKTQTQTNPDSRKTFSSRTHEQPSSPASMPACRALTQPDPDAKNGSSRSIRRDHTFSTSTDIITEEIVRNGKEGLRCQCRRRVEEQIRGRRKKQRRGMWKGKNRVSRLKN